MYLNDVIRCIRTSFYTKMSDELLHGLTLEERVDKTRAIFERILRDERLREFEPAAEVDGEFQALFFGCDSESFACQLVVKGPGQSLVKAECYMEGRLRYSMFLTSERGISSFIRWMVENVGQFMRRRADLLFVTQRLRLNEVRSIIAENPESLGMVAVRTYRYGITSWDSLVNQRGAPTVHVIANDKDGSVRDLATLVFTCPHEPAIWATCQTRDGIENFLLDVAESLEPFVAFHAAGMDL